MRRQLNKIRARLAGWVPARRTRVRALEAAVDELRADVNELRRDNLRIAQLYDIVMDMVAENGRARSARGGEDD